MPVATIGKCLPSLPFPFRATINQMKAIFIYAALAIGLAQATLPQEPAAVPISDLTRRAESGDVDAQVQLARAYEDGDQKDILFGLCIIRLEGRPGVPRDVEEAKSWCKKASEHGRRDADVVLGRMAERGIGGPADAREAERRYRSAAERASPEGILELARLKQQSSVHKDQVEAF